MATSFRRAQQTFPPDFNLILFCRGKFGTQEKVLEKMRRKFYYFSQRGKRKSFSFSLFKKKVGGREGRFPKREEEDFDVASRQWKQALKECVKHFKPFAFISLSIYIDQSPF